MPDVDTIRELAAIPIAATAIYFVYRLASHSVDKMFTLATNHMNHLATAVNNLADAVYGLRDWLRNRDDS